MRQAKQEAEARWLVIAAATIRKHVRLYGAAMGPCQCKHWLAVAEAKEQLAEALTLRPLRGAA